METFFFFRTCSPVNPLKLAELEAKAKKAAKMSKKQEHEEK